VSDLVWWFGAIHLAIYATMGVCAMAAYATWRITRYTGLLKRMIEWQVAKWRWDRRHTDGLPDDEWQRGEPRP
jgi:hypothetical protein